MGRRPLPLPKLVWFLLAGAVFTLIVSRTLPPVFIDGINCATVAHVLLLTSFGLFGLTVLEIAICYIPSLVGAQWALLLLLIGFTIFAAWAGRTQSFDWLPATTSQSKSSNLLSRIFSGNHQIAPTLPPRPPQPPSTDPVENESDLPHLQPSPGNNPNNPPIHPPPASVAPNLNQQSNQQPEQQSGNAEPSYQPASPPASPAPQLPAITVAQRNAIRNAMKPYAGLRFTLLRVNPTDDSRRYAGQIETALTSAGLIEASDHDAASTPGIYPAGLSLTVGVRQSNAADALSSAMRRIGLVTWAVPISESSNPESFQLIVAPD